MNKFSKFVLACTTLAAAAFMAPKANAAITVSFAGAGSSAVFNALADDAVNTPAVCGTNHWTFKNGGVMHDNRVSGFGTVPNETNNVWLTWDGAADGSTATVACVYVSVDSSIGVRGYMAVPRAGVFINQAPGTAGANLISTLPGDSPLPAPVLTAINVVSGGVTVGVTLNAAASDIRPEDAQFAVKRALTVQAASPTPPGLGYGNATCIFSCPYGTIRIGSTIGSSFSGSVNTPVAFEIGNGQPDPLTNNPVVAWTTYPIGAVPVLPIVSNQDNSVTGLGSGLNPAIGGAGPWVAGPYAANNINHFTAALVFDGTLTRTVDILTDGDALAVNCLPAANVGGATTGAGANNCALTQLQREPLSGTYNTWEFSVPNSHAAQDSQEDGVNPAAQPLNIVAPKGGTRLRVIGTGQMVNAVCGAGAALCNTAPSAGITETNNRIGYAFWSYGNLAALAGNHGGGVGVNYVTAPPKGHYLLLNGVDGLFNNPSDNPEGAQNPPICAAAPCPAIPFTHVIDGSYEAWNIVRLVIPQAGLPGVCCGAGTLMGNLPASAAKFSDFVTVDKLHVFRSHRDANVAGLGARNGNGCPGGALQSDTDGGQDMGGAIFTIQSDLDFAFDSAGQNNTCKGLAPADTGLTGQRQ